MATIIKIERNRDNGSVHLGKVQAKVGDSLQVVGETLVRRISYIAATRTGELVAYCRGFGPLPVGDFEITVTPATK